jgi:hypothetical protein
LIELKRKTLVEWIFHSFGFSRVCLLFFFCLLSLIQPSVCLIFFFSEIQPIMSASELCKAIKAEDLTTLHRLLETANKLDFNQPLSDDKDKVCFALFPLSFFLFSLCLLSLSLSVASFVLMHHQWMASWCESIVTISNRKKN